MNDIEDRLRAAYRSAAETISPSDLRRLDEQAAVISYPVQPARRRWLPPLSASAAAAVVVVALAVVVPSALRDSRGAGGQPTAIGNPATHFLVALSGQHVKYLTVHSVATGASLPEAVTVPAGTGYTAVATGDCRAYVAAYSKTGSCGSWLGGVKL